MEGEGRSRGKFGDATEPAAAALGAGAEIASDDSIAFCIGFGLLDGEALEVLFEGGDRWDFDKISANVLMILKKMTTKSV